MARTVVSRAGGRGELVRTRFVAVLAPLLLAFLAASLVDWPWHLAGSGAVWAACTGAVLSTSLASA